MTSTVFLRPLEPSDFDDRYLSWFKDSDVTRFLDARNISRKDALTHLYQGIESKAWRMFAICRAPDGLHIGNLKIGPVHRRHMTSDLVTVIGERNAWGKGYARAAICQGMKIAFGQMGIRKLSASIDGLNIGSIKAYTSAGFSIEARLPDQYMSQDKGQPVLSEKVFVGCYNPAQNPEPG